MESFFKRKRIIIFIIVSVFIIIFWYYNNNTIAVNRVKITSDKVKSKITFVQLCDLHGKVFGDNNETLLNKISKISPDFICVTGDMFTRNDVNGQNVAVSLLKRLSEKNKVFFVRGEHDGSEKFLEELNNVGVNVLSDQKKSIEINNNTIDIYGIGAVYFPESYNLDNVFDNPDPNHYNILMAHILNFEAYKSFGADITIVGDTHGGQVRLPFIGPVIYENTWFPAFNYSGAVYDKGKYSVDGFDFYVSSGLGSYPYDIRLFNRPEIAVFDILPKGE